MSHRQQFEYVHGVKQLFPNYFLNKNILEFGSHNINGSVRIFFENCSYIGLDAGPGKDVDVICIAHEYDLPDKTFDTVLSCEMFEHDPYWIKSFSNMIRLCVSEGLVLFTCATTGRAKHGTLYNNPNDSPNTVDLGWDYYKNLTEKDFREHFDFDMLFKEYHFSIDKTNFDLHFWGIKK
jgi:SAM-dependent methyltransferase